MLGIEYLDTLISVSNLVLILRDQKKYKEAEKINGRALKGNEKMLGIKYINI
jgi:hypothetical protein